MAEMRKMTKMQFRGPLVYILIAAVNLLVQTTAAQDASLEVSLRSLTAAHHGKVALYAEDLQPAGPSRLMRIRRCRLRR